MKSIKCFKHINTKQFNVFLSEYGYSLESVKGFNLSSIMCYHGNALEAYAIHFNGGECEYFKVVYFNSFNEYNQSRLGFNGDKLLQWYNKAHIRKYKHIIF